MKGGCRFPGAWPVLAVLLAATLAEAEPATPVQSPVQPWPMPFPERFSAVYDGVVNGMLLAELRVSLEPLGNGRYEYRSRRSAVGFGTWLSDDTVTERSLWTLAEGRVRPLHFVYERFGGDRRRSVELKFDWDAGRVTNSIDKQRWRMALERDTLDKLVYQLALMRDLAGLAPDPATVSGHEGQAPSCQSDAPDAPLCYSIADGGRLKTWRFRLLGEEGVELPSGSVRAIRVRRIRDEAPLRTTELWCAPEYGYLPVRIEYHAQSDDRAVNLRLREVHGWGASPD
jgi:hypothetical protein